MGSRLPIERIVKTLYKVRDEPFIMAPFFKSIYPYVHMLPQILNIFIEKGKMGAWELHVSTNIGPIPNTTIYDNFTFTFSQ